MYVCSCFGITEQQVRDHADSGACTPRQIASACKAGTDCGGCVRRIQALLGRGACPRRELIDQGAPEPLGAAAPGEAAAAPGPYGITPHTAPDTAPGALPEAA
ncbi:(2Fe-2S)-binding protein [Streptomyces sp. NPDC052496]|uniref:(2Fe-2S)-binding protein n=1 Tax=Streptomyces sp. NPDC052496 TaxID=3154951 RepID=UPI00341A3588